MATRFTYSVKPEQVAALQEKVKRLEAEGRLLDGTLPTQSWGQLRNENHELKRQIEQRDDVIDDYKRRLRLAEEQVRTAEKVVKVLATVIGRSCPEFAAELGLQPEQTAAVEKTETPEEALKRKKAEYNRRYYLKNRDNERYQEVRKKYYLEHRDQRRESYRRYYQQHKEEIAARNARRKAEINGHE